MLTLNIKISFKYYTVKPGNKDRPWDQNHVVFDDRWFLFSGYATWNFKGLSWPSVVFEGQRSLFPGVFVSRFHCIINVMYQHHVNCPNLQTDSTIKYSILNVIYQNCVNCPNLGSSSLRNPTPLDFHKPVTSV